MTTKPKARKYRIRPDSPLGALAQSVRRAQIGPAAPATAPAGKQPEARTDTQTEAQAGPKPEQPRAQATARLRPAAKPQMKPQSAPAARPQPQPRRSPAPQDEVDDGFGDARYPTAAPDDLLGPHEVAAETDIASIRREGLTGRQLRMARRMAQRNGLAVVSDFDAVRQLRARGLDPFRRANMLDLVVAESEGGAVRGGGGRGGLPARTDDAPAQLPATIKRTPLPSTEVNPPSPAEPPEAARARDIMRIQRDIARRRRRRIVLMAARLAFFVGLPTFLAGFYFYKVATPLYASYSSFVIQKAEPGAATSGQLGGLVAGTTFANSQDSINVQQYLQSRDAMNRLDKDNGFARAFEGDKVDPILRLPDHPSMEASYGLYQRMVQIGYDPTEGTIKMEVIAPSGQEAAQFSRALISYAEQQVDQMTQRIREDQMNGARESYEQAEKKLADAQKKVVDLQQKFKVLSSEVEVTLVTSQITALDTQLNQARLNLQELLSNPNPPQARVQPLERRIENIEERIKALRDRMTQNTANGTSLATVQSDLLAAQADVQTRQLMLSQSLQALETARVEANRQVRYLSLSVSPVAADHPTYPRAFENTLVAFLIFAGLYLMVSMTVSILREQVSG